MNVLAEIPKLLIFPRLPVLSSIKRELIIMCDLPKA